MGLVPTLGNGAHEPFHCSENRRESIRRSTRGSEHVLDHADDPQLPLARQLTDFLEHAARLGGHPGRTKNRS